MNFFEALFTRQNIFVFRAFVSSWSHFRRYVFTSESSVPTVVHRFGQRIGW
jgi:hypothetical protein